MPNLFGIISRNKKTLFLGLFFILFFSFLPIQITNLTSAYAQTAPSYNCTEQKPDFWCNGTLPAASCSAIPANIIPSGCLIDCRNAGGQAARLPLSGTTYQWYCCNLQAPVTCQNGSVALAAAQKTIDLTAGNTNITPPGTGFIWPWDNWKNDFENLGKNLLIGLPIALAAIISYFIMLIAGTLVGLLGTLMTWMIEASLNVYVVPGKAVEIVNIGWGVSRDLVNMVFILIAVFIGLATILRLQSYDVKKTLPLLIIMALLVNFSGVLVGTLVDISNLITYSFVKGLDVFSSSFSLLWENTKGLVGGLGAFFTSSLSDPNIYVQNVASPLGKIITTAAFFFILDIILFVIMLIFFLRIINLWIIVILAPIAFASYILPSTRGFWNGWWKNLIQWSIVGIPISFFLYLSSQILRHQDGISQAFGSGGGSWLANFIAQMMAPAVVIMLLMFGIGESIAHSSGVAKKIMEGGQAATKTLGKSMGKLAKRAPTDAIRRMPRTYQAGRALGLSRRRAAGESIRRYWQRRTSPVGRMETGTAAIRGIQGAVRDSAYTFLGKAFGIKRKGFKPCPACGNKKVAINAKECKVCGHNFE